MKLYHDLAGEQVETEIPIIGGNGEGLFDRKIRSFLNAIITGGQAPVPTSQILYNQAIIDGIAKSAALGREIEVVIPEI
jgi:predicted dehydrogenase